MNKVTVQILMSLTAIPFAFPLLIQYCFFLGFYYRSHFFIKNSRFIVNSTIDQSQIASLSSQGKSTSKKNYLKRNISFLECSHSVKRWQVWPCVFQKLDLYCAQTKRFPTSNSCCFNVNEAIPKRMEYFIFSGPEYFC